MGRPNASFEFTDDGHSALIRVTKRMRLNMRWVIEIFAQSFDQLPISMHQHGPPGWDWAARIGEIDGYGQTPGEAFANALERAFEAARCWQNAAAVASRLPSKPSNEAPPG